MISGFFISLQPTDVFLFQGRHRSALSAHFLSHEFSHTSSVSPQSVMRPALVQALQQMREGQGCFRKKSIHIAQGKLREGRAAEVPW